MSKWRMAPSMAKSPSHCAEGSLSMPPLEAPAPVAPWPRGGLSIPPRENFLYIYQGLVLAWAQPRSEGGSGCGCHEPVRHRRVSRHRPCRRPTAPRSRGPSWAATHSHFSGRHPHRHPRQPPSGRGPRCPPWPKAPAVGRLTPRRRPSWAPPSCRRSSGPSPRGARTGPGDFR
jgi:hypothetical protein